MMRLVIYLITIALIASGLAWLADRPGTLQVAWQGYDIETSVFRAVVILAATVAAAIFIFTLVRALWNSPAAFGDRIVRRRQKRGLEALSSGMIAVGAGDRLLAIQYAQQARKALPHEPMTHLLRAQAAQLAGDRATTRRIYEAMLASPDTEQLGLRGLFLEAEREGETEAATQFAGRALKTNPKLGWSAEALFDLQCKQRAWASALETLTIAKRNNHLSKAGIDRKRAVLLAAQAQEAEETDTEKALALALEAQNLAPELVPAAAVAGRILAGRGNTGKAAKVIHKTWARAPHPDLAAAYAYARVGDSPRDRLDRIRQLAALNPQSIESPIAVATTAIEARMYPEARRALEPLLPNRLTQRVAILMARIEAGENGDKGKVREWLARAAHTARDPVWFADGVISNRWEPVSPVTGRLDAFQWRVPAEALDDSSADLITSRIEELLAIGSNLADNSVDAASPSSGPSSGPKDHRNPPEIDDLNVIEAQPLDTGRTRTEVTRAPTPAKDAAPQPAPRTQTLPLHGTSTVAIEPKPAEPRSKPNGVAARPDPSFYVTQRAPDDPGPEETDSDTTVSPPKRPYRAVS